MPIKLIAGLWLTLMVSLSATVLARADSSSPLLAAYYDRQMAIVDGSVYTWTGDTAPKKLSFKAVQVGVGRDTQYILTPEGNLLGFRDDPEQSETLMSGVARFAAGQTGVLAIRKDGSLWWIAGFGGDRKKIAIDVVAAAVGDGTLMAWGSEYGPEPVPVMSGVVAVAAGRKAPSIAARMKF